MGIEEGTCWDESWMLYANQFVSKLKKKEEEVPSKAPSLWPFIKGKGNIYITWRFNEANSNLWQP